MRRIARSIVILVALLAGALLAALIVGRFSDGPLELAPGVPGGPLSGEVIRDPDPDWSFAREVDPIELLCARQRQIIFLAQAAQRIKAALEPELVSQFRGQHVQRLASALGQGQAAAAILDRGRHARPTLRGPFVVHFCGSKRLQQHSKLGTNRGFQSNQQMYLLMDIY